MFFLPGNRAWKGCFPLEWWVVEPAPEKSFFLAISWPFPGGCSPGSPERREIRPGRISLDDPPSLRVPVVTSYSRPGRSGVPSRTAPGSSRRPQESQCRERKAPVRKRPFPGPTRGIPNNPSSLITTDVLVPADLRYHISPRGRVRRESCEPPDAAPARRLPPKGGREGGGSLSRSGGRQESSRGLRDGGA